MLIPAEDLVSQLQLDNSYRYLPPTLKRFIEDKNTEDTAQELLGSSLKDALDCFKRDFLQRNLDHQGGSVKDTAKVLGIQRTYLSRLISKYGLTTRRGR